MKRRIVALLFGVLMAFSLVACGGDSTPAPDSVGEIEQQTEPAEEPAEEVSQEFKNALKSAKTYSDMMHMSKQGIYDQLTSEYGDQFEADAAQYAVDNLDADYNENALKSAEVYYKDMAMSKSAVYDQLISEYGDKFTEEEAQYAVDNLE